MHITAIYSSISGNTKYVLGQCQTYLQVHSHILEIKHCSICTPQDIIKTDYTILACPTYGHGQYDAVFGDYILQCEAVNLGARHYSIISLGDDRYEPGYLCETGPLLLDRITKHNGIAYGEILSLVRSPYLSHNQNLLNKRLDKTFFALNY